VVIACRDDAEWQRTAEALRHPEAVDDPRFRTFAERKANEDALEAEIGSWVRERPAIELCEALQAVGVPAGIVQNAQDMLDRDEHMKARGYYEYVDHPEAGREAHDGAAMHLSATPGHVQGPAPLLGEHTMDVCERIIGLNADEIADLLAEGVLL
jgi:benzylsuccinate CoA-transferase BbsF subunit